MRAEGVWQVLVHFSRIPRTGVDPFDWGRCFHGAVEVAEGVLSFELDPGVEARRRLHAKEVARKFLWGPLHVPTWCALRHLLHAMPCVTLYSGRGDVELVIIEGHRVSAVWLLLRCSVSDHAGPLVMAMSGPGVRADLAGLEVMLLEAITVMLVHRARHHHRR